MPQYEFFCKGCNKSFSQILTLSEYDKGKIACPDCGSMNIEQKMSPFYDFTSKKSA